MEEITAEFSDEEQIINFVSCLCYMKIKDQLYIFTENFPDGTLAELFEKHKDKIDDKLVYRMAKCLFTCKK